MSTASSKQGGCGRTLFYLLLGGAGLWLGWRGLLGLYYTLSSAGANTLLVLDLSAYGQLTDDRWPGYALLGLGLGAAGGTVAAQRRFEMGRAVAVGGWIAILALLGIVYATVEVDKSAATALLSAGTASKPGSAATSQPAANGLFSRTDTSSVAAEGKLRVIAHKVFLRRSWTDSLAKPVARLKEGAVVQLRRRTHGWVLVRTSAASSGWVRATRLGPLAASKATAAVASPTPPPRRPIRVIRKAQELRHDTSSRAATVAPAAWHPLGHQYHTGQVGDLALTLILDWEPTGELSGSGYYNQQPNATYRLTGFTEASGKLRLLLFRRGRLVARCVLQRKDDGYTGTMFNADGQQLRMRLE